VGAQGYCAIRDAKRLALFQDYGGKVRLEGLYHEKEYIHIFDGIQIHNHTAYADQLIQLVVSFTTTSTAVRCRSFQQSLTAPCCCTKQLKSCVKCEMQPGAFFHLTSEGPS
jgi:hypothetical protein